MYNLILCLDISESMVYGEPAKLDQAVRVVQKAIGEMNRNISVGLVTFDVTAEIVLEPKPSNQDEIRRALERIVPRGVTCLADGLSTAIGLARRTEIESKVLLLTDGRSNLSLNRMGGFEGSISLERELLKIAAEVSPKDITINTVAIGEDAFAHTLAALAMITKGHFWFAEEFRGIAFEPSSSAKPVKTTDLRVHDAPAELPSARPTWSKESQMMHVAVVCQRLYETYLANRKAFLVSAGENREARTALLSVESEVLTYYRERRAKTAEAVKNGEAILVDRSYRDFLALGENSPVRLNIY